MKQIKEIVTKELLGAQLKTNAVNTVFNEESKKIIDELFEILKIHCKSFDYVLAHNVNEGFCKREWVKTFQVAGITKQRLQIGINKIRTEGYGKMIYPNDFIKLTYPDPEDIGAPSINYAFKIALRNSVPSTAEKEWVHPTVRYATHKVTSWALSHDAESVVFPKFKEAYAEGCLMFSQGKLLDLIATDDSKFKDEKQMQKEIAEPFKNMNNKHSALLAIRNMLR
jgi:hypothetical protein